MGYATTESRICLFTTPTALFNDTTTKSKPAGQGQAYSFTIMREVYPIASLKMRVEARSTGADNDLSRVWFFRNGTIVQNQKLLTAWTWYEYEYVVSNCKIGDVYLMSIATTIGAGGTSESRNRQLYVYEGSLSYAEV